MNVIRRQPRDHRLTTAEILYHMPDYPRLLQRYIWQDYDTAPRFPVLHRFLEFWRKNLDDELHSVHVASQPIITPPRFRAAKVCLTLQ